MKRSRSPTASDQLSSDIKILSLVDVAGTATKKQKSADVVSHQPTVTLPTTMLSLLRVMDAGAKMMSYLDDTSRASLARTCRDAAEVSTLPDSYHDVRTLPSRLITLDRFSLVQMMQLTEVKLTGKLREVLHVNGRQSRFRLELESSNTTSIDLSSLFAQSRDTLRKLHFCSNFPLVATQLATIGEWAPKLTSIIMNNRDAVVGISELKCQLPSVKKLRVICNVKVLTQLLKRLPGLEDLIIDDLRGSRWGVDFSNVDDVRDFDELMVEMSSKAIKKLDMRTVQWSTDRISAPQITGLLADTLEELQFWTDDKEWNCGALRSCKLLKVVKVLDGPMSSDIWATPPLLESVFFSRDRKNDGSSYLMIPSVRELISLANTFETDEDIDVEDRFNERTEYCDAMKMATAGGFDTVRMLREHEKDIHQVGGEDVHPYFEISSSTSDKPTVILSYYNISLF
jgi:hypothetical protein